VCHVRNMWLTVILCVFVWGSVRADDDKCDVTKYEECMGPFHNATFGHEHGLFQDASDLQENCPVIRRGIDCIRDYAKECGTEMIAENFQDQFERPATFLLKICDTRSTIRKEYLKASPCFRENAEDLEICSTKVQEFLAFHEADTVAKELTMTCMYEMMLRACLMSTAAEKCGMDAATFMRKALLYSPSLGMETCKKETDD